MLACAQALLLDFGLRIHPCVRGTCLATGQRRWALLLRLLSTRVQVVPSPERSLGPPVHLIHPPIVPQPSPPLIGLGADAGEGLPGGDALAAAERKARALLLRLLVANHREPPLRARLRARWGASRGACLLGCELCGRGSGGLGARAWGLDVRRALLLTFRIFANDCHWYNHVCTAASMRPRAPHTHPHTCTHTHTHTPTRAHTRTPTHHGQGIRNLWRHAASALLIRVQRLDAVAQGVLSPVRARVCVCVCVCVRMCV